jgi:hypothetical protein
MSRLNKLLAFLILFTLAAPLAVNVRALAPQPSTQVKQALIISSLNSTMPMGDDANLAINYLKGMGYNTTYLTDGSITVGFVLHGLGNYSVVIWRTNTYISQHTVYWYIGQTVSGEAEQQYATDFNYGWLNAHAGVIGMTGEFIQNHFKAGTLKNIKLLIFVGSYGNSIVPSFLTAGVKTVIFCNGVISLQGGLIDDLTVSILDYMAKGQNVDNAVFNTVSPYAQYTQPQDEYDSTYAPPFWYNGDGTLTLV